VLDAQRVMNPDDKKVQENGVTFPLTPPYDPTEVREERCGECGKLRVPDRHGKLRHPSGSLFCSRGPGA
jgi:hypothetical protein